MMMEVNTPVLLIAFNRPDTTQKVFNIIKEVAPRKLYIAIDGPRNNKKGERSKCKQVHQITKNVDWQCETHYLIRENNLGCKDAVTSAISWTLSKEDRVIVIEDDVLPEKSFFSFAEDLLEKYKDNPNIAMISGNNYTPFDNPEYDYHFSKYGHIWGWATWKRVWEEFDVNLSGWEENKFHENLLKKGLCNEEEIKFYQKKLYHIKTQIENKTINTWDSQFGLFRIGNGMLSIVPAKNLSSNIGEASSRTTNIVKGGQNYYPSYDNFKIINYPPEIMLNWAYDNIHFKNHIRKRKSHLNKRIIKKLKNLVKI